ncbi:MAG: hypothetical protein HY782_15865 [Chloroflexi bacterium]|nr:hypothetical protein [Chloroflexota bacterium]
MLEVRESARPLLTDRMQGVVDRLLPVLDRAASQHHVPVEKIVVSGFADPEDDSTEIVVTQWTPLPAPAALAYWDQLGLMVEEWTRSLPGPLAALVTDKLAIAVEWDPHGANLRPA